EIDGEIAVVHIGTGTIRTVGSGTAPRPIPFSNQFVFLRERPNGQFSTVDGIARTYDVFLGAFNAPGAESIGSLRAVSRSDVNGGASPVAWMVVAEAGDGSGLRGDNIESFPLAAPVWSPGAARGR